MSEAKTISGQVGKVYVNTFDDGNTSVSFKLRGDTMYYRLGNKRFAGIVEEGKTISFKAAQVKDNAFKVLSTPKAAAPSEEAVSGGGPGGRTGNGFGSNDSAIRYQSSRKDALEMARLAIDAEVIKLPPKNGLAALEALVDRYTAAFFADIETKGAVARTAEPAKAAEPKAKAKAAEPEGVEDAPEESDEMEEEWDE